jgi:hypothetical protein
VHFAAIVLIAAAGCCYCAAALLRWRLMGKADAPQPGYLWPMWAGMALHTASLVLSLLDTGEQDFAYGVLGVWAGVASLLFVSRYLAVPSRGVLALPVGGMALLVAMAELTGPVHLPPAGAPTHWISIVHGVFMALHLAVMALAGAAGGLWLVAARQLKSPSVRALRLPNLPLLERLCERSLVVGTALLLGGLATGGAAMQLSRSISLAHPTIVLALVTMALLVMTLALRAANALSRRGIAVAAVAAMALAALGSVSQLVARHG